MTLLIAAAMVISALAIMPVASADAEVADIGAGNSVANAPATGSSAIPQAIQIASKITTKIHVFADDFSELNAFLISNGLEGTGQRPNPVLSEALVEVPENLVSLISSLPSVKAVVPDLQPVLNDFPMPEPVSDQIAPNRLMPSPTDYWTTIEHHADDAWSMGYTGAGVQIAILDSGVDFGHPDLQGRQARLNDLTSAYDGWPIVYDVGSLATYNSTGSADGTWYVETVTRWALNDIVYFDGYAYDVSGTPSDSDLYRIGYHPDQNLQDYYGEPVAVLLTASAPGVWDTVYVDLLNDKSFNNDKPCTWGDEISYSDFYDWNFDTYDYSGWNTGDGYADLSGGMIYWISDGINAMPLGDALYTLPRIPGDGEIIAFVGEFILGESHGTGTSSSAVGTGLSSSYWAGMAPGATIIAVPIFNGGNMLQSWLSCIVGYDNNPATLYDQADIASNSYGFDSLVWTSGVDTYSDINMFMARVVPTTTWLWSTGNGGPGYGTSNSIVHPLAIQVGASASMGYRAFTTSMVADMWNEMYGDVIPFSDHGPNDMGKLDTDIIAAGAWGVTPAPLYENLWYVPPDGSWTYMVFGGTSMSCPVVAGGLAQIYEAFFAANGRFPYYYEAKNLLMSSADDVNHDVLRQGAGLMNVERGCLLASNTQGVSVEPWAHPSGMTISDNAWYPGDYRGIEYVAFPNLMYPGDLYTRALTLRNHNPGAATSVTITDEVFQKSIMTDFSYVTVDGNPFYFDITPMIPPSTDLIRVTAYCDYDTYFDPGRMYTPAFNYGLELHNWWDIDGMGDVGMTELNRITVDGGVSNILQVTMHDPIARAWDGLILRMTNYWGGMPGILWNFHIDCYERQDWSWVSAAPATVNIPAGATASSTVSVSVPLAAEIGTYEGALYLAEAGLGTTVIPVLIHVTADGPSVEFGGNLIDSPIYDNQVSGVADREWRYEVGDGRTYYMDIPDVYPIAANDRLYVTVNWSDVPTDIDVRLLGNAGLGVGMGSDAPYLLGEQGGSEDLYFGAGNFGFQTTTGGAQEIVSIPFAVGLNAIQLRCSIGAGLSPYEEITGYTKVFDDSVAYAPTSHGISLKIPQNVPSGSLPVFFMSTSASGLTNIPFAASATGPFGGTQWTALSAIQSDYTIRGFEINTGPDYLLVSTESAVPGLDIDLEVYYYDGANYILMGSSAGASATEAVMISYPANGPYVAAVYGYAVPGGTQPFDMSVEYPITGASPFTVTDVPANIDPGLVYQFNVTFDLPYIGGFYMGTVSFGFYGSTALVEIPITIYLEDCAAPNLYEITPMYGETLSDPTPMLEVGFDDSTAYTGLDESSVYAELDGADVSALVTFGPLEEILLQVPFLLADGWHSYYVEASDGYGNGNWIDLGFWVDTVSEITVSAQDSGGLIPVGGVTNENPITVAGTTETTSSVTINGVPATVNPGSGAFSESVMLIEGSNSIEVIATDAVGNVATVDLVVVLDTAVMLYVEPIPSPTTLSMVMVQGTVEIGASVWVAGNPLGVSATGQWSTSIAISEGANAIAVTANDLAGNWQTILVFVNRDSTPPAISIDSPTDWSTVATNMVTVSLTSESGATVIVNGVTATDLGGGSFEAAIPLPDGINTVLATATDAIGNSASTSITVIVDTYCDMGMWAEDDLGNWIWSGNTTSDSTVWIEGYAENGADVYVNGVWTPLVTGQFIEEVTLVEGPNLILVDAWDAVGNYAWAEYLINLDTTVNLYVAPIDSPTRLTMVTVYGMMEGGGTVTVNGNPVTVTNGYWTTVVALIEGLNNINVQGTDAFGNVKLITVQVTRDTTAPTVNFVSPAASSTTSSATVTVVVSATGSPAWVAINGVTAQLRADGNYSANITLLEGWNTVMAVAQDALGNTATVTMQLRYTSPFATDDELNDAIDDIEDQMDELNDSMTDQLNDTNNNMDDMNDDLSNQIDSLNTTMMMGLIGVLVALLVAIMAVFMMLAKRIKQMGGPSPPAPGPTQLPPPPPPAPPREKL